MKENSFIIESTDQINTQRKFNDNTVICLPSDVRECVSKYQYQILTTGGNNSNSETEKKKITGTFEKCLPKLFFVSDSFNYFSIVFLLQFFVLL